MSATESQERKQGISRFSPVSSKVSFPEMEQRVLAWWKERDMLRQVEGARQGAPLFVLHEGPPTANGKPGIHHVLSRVFKDVIPRYKTMRGYLPLRKGGWDTHGLPVELEVEKALGISSKQQIEDETQCGIGKFNAECRASVFRYVKDWEALTERVGFWVDMENAYVTLHNSYIETIWWMLRQLWDKGLVYQDMKGVPHCPRCVTTLSSHEVALGYQENTPDPSVYIKFRVTGANTPLARELVGSGVPTYILAWTTTPWTLPGNTALAVAPDAEYALVEVELDGQRQRLVLAQALLDKALQHPYQVKRTLRGIEMEGLTYELLYAPADFGTAVSQFRANEVGQGTAARLEPRREGRFTPTVVTAPMVSLEDGTGIVHIAPAFGDEDLHLGREKGLAFVQNVDLQGKVTGNYPFAGRFVKEADPLIMDELTQRGLLYRHDTYYHTYPFCWRCSSPLLYYAKPSWYLRTAAVKELLVQRNGEINWYPEHIKEGRFGEWLRNNVDWAISRERYWGTPLPFWQCAGCGRYQCIGSVQELRELAVPPTRSLVYSSGLDLHRPYVDNVILRCEKCRGEMHRIPEVLDVWFDSGAMPLAQHHYPFENDAILTDGRYPGDYICEAVDQTRGWFYSLHAIAALLEHATDGRIKAPSYRNVICLGLVLDEKGEKMSKSRGNVVDPWSVINAHGADAVRWYLFTATQPGESRRFSTALVGDVVRRFFLTLWNTYAFFVTYANLDRFDPRAETPAKPANDLDRWVLSELNSLVAEVTESLERYDPTGAGRRIEEFVELLSTWYVRRSRRRFWKSGDDQDKRAALQTLYTCLATLAKLLAPLTPFLAEELYGNLVRSVDSKAPESVHLAPWPEADRSLIDPELGQAVRLAMRVVSLGRAARNKARIKVRQPLQAVLVKARTPEEEKALLLRVKDQVADELNVKELRLLRDVSEVVSFRISPNMAALGQKYGRRAREAAEALGKLDPAEVAQKVQAGAPVQAGKFTLLTEEVNLATQEAAGMSVAMEEGYTVAVTTEMTAELREEGLARELVHRLQNMRRAAGLDISDRIHTFYQGPEALRSAFLRHADYIAGETLSLKLVEGPPPDDAYMEQQKLDGMEVTLGIRKASQTPGVPGP